LGADTAGGVAKKDPNTIMAAMAVIQAMPGIIEVFMRKILFR
jgi:hypothetical protein